MSAPAGACSSSKDSGKADDDGGGSGCEAFCESFVAGCPDASQDPCVADCNDSLSACPAHADALIECLAQLEIECLDVGYAVAHSRTSDTASTSLTGAAGTLEVQDPTCAALADTFNACPPPSTSSNTGGGGAGGEPTSGPGGAGRGGSGGSGASGSGGTGGGEPCPDPAYPILCPGQHGMPDDCWSQGTDCSTIVPCPSGPTSCGTGEAVDCAANACVLVLAPESTNALCSNNTDDDANTYIDCDDFHCLFNAAVTVCNSETTDYECSNGMDDDGNGFTDCADVACHASPAVTVCPGEKLDAECSNSADDDGNGYIDCADFACVGSPFVSVCN
jgi:hypothetical protein